MSAYGDRIRLFRVRQVCRQAMKAETDSFGKIPRTDCREFKFIICKMDEKNIIERFILRMSINFLENKLRHAYLRPGPRITPA